MAALPIRIEPARTRQEKKDFIKFPLWLYRKHLKDANWVPQLISDRLNFIDPDKNPFFEHSEAEFYVARRDGQIVGTIAAILNNNHNKVHQETTGFFGLFECIQDFDVAEALFDAASEWVESKGMNLLRGPFNLNINDDIGLLVDGFDSPPVVMMPYNPPYYEGFMDDYGFVKAKDVYAYTLKVEDFRDGMPERVRRVAKKMQERHNIVVRQIDMKHFYEDVEKIKVVYNQAWSKNWGAVPMTEHEIDDLAEHLKQIVDPALVYLAEMGGEPVGVFVGIPDANQILIHMDGSLFPFGFLKFLWYQRKVTGMRALIGGVLEEHRLKGIDALLYMAVAAGAVPKGYLVCEASWILEDNFKIRRGVESLGGKIYKTYRVYDAPVG